MAEVQASPARPQPLSDADTATLAATGRGTSAGDYLRRYWQPVALIAEVPAGGAPVPLTVMGEDLVLYRDSRGELGLIGRWCPHRGVDLSYSRVEDSGLRCLFHGWLLGRDGSCLEQPGQPVGTEFAADVRHSGYPVVEAAGCVFAYLGPGEPPRLPAYDVFTADPAHVLVKRNLYECNWVTSMDHSLDPGHVSFLHRQFPESEASGRYGKSRSLGITGSERSANTLYSADVAPDIEVQEADYGLKVATVRQVGNGEQLIRVFEFYYPNVVTSPMVADGYILQFHVPRDDRSHWRFDIFLDRATAFDHDAESRIWNQGHTPDGRSLRTLDNRFGQDRAQMQDWYAGMGAFPPDHDGYVLEASWPPALRGGEHLGSQDIAIDRARRLMLAAIDAVRRGDPPPVTGRDGLHPLVAFSTVVPSGRTWRELYREHDHELRRRAGLAAPEEAEL